MTAHTLLWQTPRCCLSILKKHRIQERVVQNVAQPTLKVKAMLWTRGQQVLQHQKLMQSGR